MKKVLALVLAVFLIATMGGVALAQSPVEPSEVNIVLPPGSIATVEKTVTIGEVTTDVWGVVTADIGLDVELSVEQLGVVGPTDVYFNETIEVDVWGGVPLYATVTFYRGTYSGEGTVIGTQTISVTEGYLDIKAGSYPNSINTKSNGVIPVALLGHAGLNVTNVDVTTLTFGPLDASPKHDLTDPVTLAEHIQDVNYDGIDDLVSHYKGKLTGIAVGDLTADLDYDLIIPAGVTTVSDSVNVIK